MTSYPSRALIDMGALAHNLKVLGSATSSALIPIVKADAYGHGLPMILAGLADAPMVGIAQMAEALGSNRDGRVLTWIYDEDTDLTKAVHAGLDISIGAPWAIRALAEATRMVGRPARVHVEVDTGMTRSGLVSHTDIAEVSAAVAAGLFEPVGLWSHLARADEPDNELTRQQVERFREYRQVCERVGYRPQMMHLAATAGTLWHPLTHFDAVRPGIGLYGLSPNPEVATADQLGLRPVMTVVAPIVSLRDIETGVGVSYGHAFVSANPMRIATVPLGYADGVPRSASNRAEVSIRGMRCPVVGKICMDQFMVAVPENVQVGDTVTLWGAGGPSADEWAGWADTIGYEITTRLGPRVPRVKMNS